MASTWYIARDGQQWGPYTSQQLRALVAGGQLVPTDMLWQEGMQDWVAANRFRGLFDAPPSRQTTTRETSPVHDPQQAHDSAAAFFNALERGEADFPNRKQKEKVVEAALPKAVHLPGCVGLPEAVRGEAAQLAASNSAQVNRSRTSEWMKASRWRDALPFAAAEVFASGSIDAMVRVGMCFQNLAEASCSAGKVDAEVRANLELSLQWFDAAEQGLLNDAAFYTLRGGAYLLKAQVASDKHALGHAETDLQKALRLNPSDASLRRNLELVEIVRVRLSLGM